MPNALSTAYRLPGLMAGIRPLIMLVGLAAAVALGVAVVLWSQAPTYSLLYSNLPDDDVAAVSQALGAAGIPYRLENGTGALSVAQERLNDARLLLAGKGVVESGGFANLAKENGFGTSQFMEGARYQHALETELARTIASLQQVASARVHIAAARETGFVRDRVRGGASVFLQLKPGRRLSSEQVTSVVNLVASSLPNLEADRITVVDQQGRLLSSPRGRDPQALRDQQIEFARQFEESYAQRIETLLAPLVGAGRVRAEVSAEFDMSVSEEAREQFRPDSQIVRREQLAEDRRSTTSAGGVPGSLSNQPPGKTPAAATGTEGTPPNSVQSTRDYEIDRTVAYTQQPAGRIKRLSVAVLIDHVDLVGKDGKPKPTPLDAKQLERIDALVKDAVGFDEKRGDRVSVLNSPWSGEPRSTDRGIDDVPLWQQPWVRDAAKLVLGALLVMVLLLTIVRPLLRQYAAMMPRASTGASISADDAALALSGDSVGAGPMTPAKPKRPAYEDDIARARSLVNEDPARVAQVVKKWVASDA